MNRSFAWSMFVLTLAVTTWASGKQLSAPTLSDERPACLPSSIIETKVTPYVLSDDQQVREITQSFQASDSICDSEYEQSSQQPAQEVPLCCNFWNNHSLETGANVTGSPYGPDIMEVIVMFSNDYSCPWAGRMEIYERSPDNEVRRLAWWDDMELPQNNGVRLTVIMYKPTEPGTYTYFARAFTVQSEVEREYVIE